MQKENIELLSLVSYDVEKCYMYLLWVTQKFKAMYEAKLEFTEGWEGGGGGGGGGGHRANPFCGEVWIFSGTTHYNVFVTDDDSVLIF